MRVKQYEVLLLDVDGTLLDFDRAEEQGIESLLEHFQVPVTKENKDAYHRLNQSYWQRLERGELTRDQVLGLRFEEYFGRFGITVDGMEVDQLYRQSLEQCAFLVDGAKELLEEHPELTAIVGLNDMIAFGIMDALHDAKYKVPGDMSVMGCDNTLFAKVKEVSLTTIEHFVIYKGMDACDIIIKKMDPRMKKYSEIEPVSIYHVEYEPRIAVRGTTSYPPSEKRKINR